MKATLLEAFKKKVIEESKYDKWYSRNSIDFLCDYFNTDVETLEWTHDYQDPLKAALDYYETYFPEYFLIIKEGIDTGLIKFTDKKNDTNNHVNTGTGEVTIRSYKNDKSVSVYVHEFGHIIDIKSEPRIISKEFTIFGETVALYFEKVFESKKENETIARIRKNHRLCTEKDMLKAIRLMLKYEDYYKEHNRIEEIINLEEVEFIMSYKLENTVNSLLRYPVGNIMSEFMLVEHIPLRSDLDKTLKDISIIKAAESPEVKRRILL